MMVLYEFFNLLAKQVSTGVWDVGMLVATFIYAVLVGIIGGFSGLLNLNMPFEQWLPVLLGIWGQYFLYLTALHTVADLILAKIFPVAAPQGLITPFLTKAGKQEFSYRK